MKKPQYGYVYVLTNPSMPGLVKIGMTSRTPEVRARELSSTGVPQPFKVAYSLEVRECKAVEAALHRHLKAYRVNRNREFFRIEVDRARQVVDKIALGYQHRRWAFWKFATVVVIVSALIAYWFSRKLGTDVPIAAGIAGVVAIIALSNGCRPRHVTPSPARRRRETKTQRRS